MSECLKDVTIDEILSFFSETTPDELNKALCQRGFYHIVRDIIFLVFEMHLYLTLYVTVKGSIKLP